MQQQEKPQPGEVQQQEEPRPVEVQQEQDEPQPGEVQQEQDEPQPGEVQEEQDEPQPGEVQLQQQEPRPVEVQQQQQNESQPGEVQQQQDKPCPDEVQQQQDEPMPVEVQQQQARATSTTARPQTQRPQECGVCLFVYEEQERRPRNLPCGHTFCSLCVAVLLEDGRLTCPSCRTDHLAPSADHFPVAYVVEAMVRELQAASQAMGGASASAGEASLSMPTDSQAREVKIKQKAAAGLSRKLRSMVQEQQTSMGSLATPLQQELDQLNQYRAQLALCRAKHGCLLEELDKLAQQHRAAIELLQQEDARVEAFVEEGEEVHREMWAAWEQLEQVSTPQEAFSKIDAADHTAVEAEEWLQHSREEMPNSTALSTSWKVVEATKAALEAVRAEAEAKLDLDTSGHLDCTIMEAVQSLQRESFELVDLHSKRLRKRLEAGKVFAVQKHEGGTCYSSKITLDGNKILLHALQEGSPPQGASILKVSKAMEGLDYCSILVFLDLSWPGMPSCRVHIKLQADTPLTRQFVALCLGHTGLTYHSTKFLNLKNNNCPRIVWGGDISGKRAEKCHHLPPLQAKECGNCVQPVRGMVVAGTDLSNTAQNTQFGIVIGGGDDSHSNSYYCLGGVGYSGMSIIEKVVNKGITANTMRVVDCGIVFSPAPARAGPTTSAPQDRPKALWAST